MILQLLVIALLAPPQTVATGDASLPASTLSITTDTWAASSGPAFFQNVETLVLRDSPKDSFSAALAVGANKSLMLSTFDGASWGTATTLALDIGDKKGMTFDAAFESSSGKLLIVYRKAKSPLLYYRVFDPAATPSLSLESWFDLAMLKEPKRVRLASKPGSDSILLIVSNNKTVRAAIWNGTTFASTTTLDLAFDNKPETIAGEWSKSNAIVLWARKMSTTPQGAVFDGTAWAPAAGLPSAAFAIAPGQPTIATTIKRIELAPSNDRASGALLLTMVSEREKVKKSKSSKSNKSTKSTKKSKKSKNKSSSSSSTNPATLAKEKKKHEDSDEYYSKGHEDDDRILHAAVFDAAGWSAATLLTPNLRDKSTYSAWWETSGTAAIAVWQNDSERIMHTARMEAGVWTPTGDTVSMGGKVERMISRPAQNNPAGVRTLISIKFESKNLNDYVAYANQGTMKLGALSVANGLTGANMGFPMPAPPAAPNAPTTGGLTTLGQPVTPAPAPAAVPVTVGSGQAVALAPGSYGAVSVGSGSTLNLSTGRYVFASMSPGASSLTLHADTTGGPVILEITTGSFDAKNALTVSTTGNDAFEIHLIAGDFLAASAPTINASIITHLGGVTLGNNSAVIGHLIASGSVTLGSSSTLDPPNWDSPFEGHSKNEKKSMKLIALTTLGGALENPVTLVSGWTQEQRIPFDLSWQRPASGVRITSWREVPSSP